MSYTKVSGKMAYANNVDPVKTSPEGKCPKISYTKVSDKMAYANSADPDQTAPVGAF